MTSLYERLGGEAAVDAAVERFYGRVLADDRIRHFFDGVDMAAQSKKQKAFLTVALGGPNRYTGRGMAHAHRSLVERGLDDSHFDAVVENLGATLKDLGVSDGDIAEAASIVESTREQVLGRA